MQLESLLGAAGIGVIVGVVTILKNAGFPTRFAPSLSLVLGLILVLGYRVQYGGLLFDQIFQGLVLGLSASGIYSGVQTTSKGATVLRESEVEEYDVIMAPKGSVQNYIGTKKNPEEVD